MKTLEIKTTPVKEEVVSPREFIELPKSDIAKSRFIPPKIGSKSFGTVKVEYKHLKFKPIG